jgi:hypothetical protein
MSIFVLQNKLPSMLRVKYLVVFSGIFFVLLLSACVKHASTQNRIITENGNKIIKRSPEPYIIDKDIVVDSGKWLRIESGAHLLFKDSARIRVKGGLHIDGTAGDSVILRSSEPDSAWGGILLDHPTDSCIIRYAAFYNGRIYGLHADVLMKNSSFYNNVSLAWNDAIMRLFYGSLQVSGTSVRSNNTGEGFLLHHMKKMISVDHCTFHGVNDAVEMLLVKQNASVSNSRFYNVTEQYGDGIDLDGCQNILIHDNYFENIIDAGIEVSNDKYGPCLHISTWKNIFVACGEGMVIKGGSDALVRQSTFYNNKFGVSCIINGFGNNRDPNHADINSTIFYHSASEDVHLNQNSTATLQYTLSDKTLFAGTGNSKGDPDFQNAAKRDFSLRPGSPCIDTGDPHLPPDPDGSRADMGAIPFSHHTK